MYMVAFTLYIVSIFLCFSTYAFYPIVIWLVSNFFPFITREKEIMPVKMLTQDEAVMKLELAGEPFLIYKSEEDQKLKVMYRRKDEKLGIVEIEK